MDIEEILAETRAQVATSAERDLSWVAGQVVAPRRLIVLVRKWTTAPILGYTWLPDEELRDNDPAPSTGRLAGWFVDEMEEPNPSGFILRLPLDSGQVVGWSVRLPGRAGGVRSLAG